MRRFVSLIFLCAVFLMVQAQQKDAQQGSGFQASPVIVSNYYDIENGKYFRVHIVEKGHTLYSIAKAYKCAVSDIIKTSSDNTISIGEAVRIPLFSQEDIKSFVRYNVSDTLAKNQQLAQAADEIQAAPTVPINETDISIKSQSTSEKYLPLQPKDIINISLMLPLYTSDINFPKKQYYFLTMLEGVLVAVEENNANNTQDIKGPKINLNVFDLTEDEISWNNVKNDKRFLDSDIIL